MSKHEASHILETQGWETFIVKKCILENCLCIDSKEWRVNAPEYNNCYFTYFTHNNRSHTLAEVSKLLGISINAVSNIEKRAIAKLKLHFEKKSEEKTGRR